MTFEEKKRKIQSLMNGTGKLEDIATILNVDDTSIASQGYVAQLREEGDNSELYHLLLPQKKFENIFEDRAAVNTPKKLAAVVKSLRGAECGIMLDVDGWKTLREKCIQRAYSSVGKKGERTH